MDNDSPSGDNAPQQPPDKPQFITAWDAVTEHYYDIGETVYIRLKGGRTLYESAEVVYGRNGEVVLLQRLDNRSLAWLRAIKRRIHPDTLVELVPRTDAAQTGGAS